MSSHEPPCMQGYMLKKKRKKLQGMARRWFTLSATGALSYSFNPNSPVRDSIFVSLAYVSASRKQRTFHIDSGNTVMHCKALTEGDFDKWTMAFKKFVGTVQEQQPRNGQGQRATAIVTDGESEVASEVDLVMIFGAVARMTAPIQELESIHTELKNHDPQLSLSNSPPTVTSSPKLKFLKKRTKSQLLTATSPLGSSPTSSSNAYGSNNAHLGSNLNANPGKNTSGGGIEDNYFDVKPTSESLLKALGHAISIIKAQHDLLASQINTLPTLGTATSPSPYLPSGPLSVPGGLRSAHGSRAGLYTTGNGSIGDVGAALGHRRNRSRASSFSIDSEDTTNDFYEDAIPGEFIMEDEDSDEDVEDKVRNPLSNGTGEKGDKGSKELSTAPSFSSSNDESLQEEEDEDDDSSEDSTKNLATRVDSEKVKEKVETVRRRNQLPAPVSGDEFSMLSMLRKNVGKDLSTISFPVTFNEPLSALQRIAEEMEYTDLLHRAVLTKDKIERLILVATFVVSGSSGNRFRSSRKPFNPLLGETYECVRPDKGFKFIAEKVSHHPPVMAFYSEGKGWKVDGFVAPSQKFWGRSMEVFVTGDFNVTFDDDGQVYSVRKPSSFVRNLVAGTKYLEIVGDLVITNETTGDKATINYKEGSTWGGATSRNKIDGRICDASGSLKAELVGRWDECVDRKEGKDSYKRVWVVNDFPQNPERHYGFSHFSSQLNEMTSLDVSAAPTDSRRRPDQLALEHGDVDDAEEIKKRVEEKQRARRGDGSTVKPMWFSQEGEGWKFRGEYFETRDKKAFLDLDIF